MDSFNLKIIVGFVVLCCCQAQIRFPDEDKKNAIKKSEKSEPQTRFFGLFGQGGVGAGIASLFNPCTRCNVGDLTFARGCCQRGEIQCCQFSGGIGGGFGGHHGGGFGGHHGSGLGGHHGGGFGGHHGGGFGGHHGGGLGGNHGSGLGGHHGNGFGSHLGGGAGFHGDGFGSTVTGGSHGFGGGFKTKPGICPKPSIIKDVLGIRKLDDKGKGPSARSSIDTKRPKRQSEKSIKPRVVGSGDNTQSRFFPGLENFPNPFCRDECFSDHDCFGNLKCCINSGSCRICNRPRFF